MAVTAPACRHCNYLVAGLPTLVCPECGSDLREVGIRVPGEGRTQGIAGPLVAAALLVFVPIIMLNHVVSGRRVTVTHSIGFKPFWYQQKSNPIQSFSVTGAGAATYWLPLWGPIPDSVQRITFGITVAGHSAATTPLSANIDGMCRIGNSPPRRLDESTALGWLKKAGLNPSTAQARRLASDIVACIPAIREDGMEAAGFADLHHNSLRYTSGGSSNRWPMHILWLTGGLLWVILAWRIWRLKDHPLRSIPQCRGCGCDASRFTDFLCPQCGRDARECGIRVVERHRWSGLAVPLSLCALLVLGIGGITGNVLGRVFWQYNFSNYQTFSPRPDLQEKEPLEVVGIRATASRLYLGRSHSTSISNFVPDKLGLTVQVKHHRPVIATLQPNGRWRYQGKDGQEIQQPWSEAALLAMLKTAGLDPSERATRRLAAEILRAVLASWKGTFADIHVAGLWRGFGTGGGLSEAGWLAEMQWLFWLVVWGVFVVLELRHHRRAQRKSLPDHGSRIPASDGVAS